MVFEMRNIIILFSIYLITYNTTTYPRCANNNFTEKKLSINNSSLSGKFKFFGDPYEEPTGSEGLIGNSITVNGPDQEYYAFGLMANYTKITG